MEKKQVLAEVAARLTEPFKHLVVGQVDDYCAYLTRIEGAYLYHQHPKDEMYLVVDGELCIDYEDGTTVTLHKDETLVVHAGEKHRSRSETEALVLMFKAQDLFAE
ncbi:MAG: cupin domain-containing protein [Anaerolineae bacterium]|jgi:mannose-6-phosphate isomerase-like protein (cupin superfamily)